MALYFSTKTQRLSISLEQSDQPDQVLCAGLAIPSKWGQSLYIDNKVKMVLWDFTAVEAVRLARWLDATESWPVQQECPESDRKSQLRLVLCTLSQQGLHFLLRHPATAATAPLLPDSCCTSLILLLSFNTSTSQHIPSPGKS